MEGEKGSRFRLALFPRFLMFEYCLRLACMGKEETCPLTLIAELTAIMKEIKAFYDEAVKAVGGMS